MITVFDAGNYAQQVFFNKAFAYLKAQGQILNPDELAADKFLSIDSYFAHIQELVTIDPSFVLIPTDEAPFEIDANSRQIKIPADFAKCAGVTGDSMSEIVTFTVDRYFDYVDLARAQICVQWDTGTTQGISHIGLRDLDTAPGKIRFGWPLTGAITEKAGNVSFAVRFFIEKEIEVEGEGVQRQIVYLFNTLPANLPIKAGLNVSGESAVVEASVADLFSKFVTNSTNPSYAMPQAVSYVKNLPEQSKVDKNSDTVTLEVEATVPDNGYIKYNWYLKYGTEDRSDIGAVTVKIDGRENIDPNYLVKDRYESKGVGMLTKPNGKQYYYKLADGKYVLAALDAEGNLPKDKELFERFSTLTIKAGGKKEITGLYYVGASNYVGQDKIEIKDSDGNVLYEVDGMNHTPETRSVQCLIPVPDDVVIPAEKDLPINVFIEDVDKAILQVIPENDNGNPDRTFSWKYTTDEMRFDDVFENKWVAAGESDPVFNLAKDGEGLDMVTSITDVPGWYYVHINSCLNRDEREADSKVCRVVNHTKTPILKENGMTYVKGDIDLADTIYAFDAIKDSDWANVPDGGSINVTLGTPVRLKVDFEDWNGSRLETDKMEYEWFVLMPDMPELSVTPEMITAGTFILPSTKHNTNVLDVRSFEDKRYSYYCKVTNTLAGESKVFGAENYKYIFHID